MEQKEHIRKGFERIEKYYTSPLDKRKAETRLSKPPQEKKIKDLKEVLSPLGRYLAEGFLVSI